MAIYLLLQILRFTWSSVKRIEKLSRRHFINSFDVFNIKGLTVFKFWVLFWILSLQVFIFMCIHAVWKLGCNQNWTQKSSLLYWYIQNPLYLIPSVIQIPGEQTCIGFQNETSKRGLPQVDTGCTNKALNLTDILRILSIFILFNTCWSARRGTCNPKSYILYR